MSSADWMPRNFHRRVEVMCPIEQPDLKQRILKEVIPIYLRDNMRARILKSDGSYVRVVRADGEPEHRCQEEFLALRPIFTVANDRITTSSLNDAAQLAKAAH
jgi:polyphosphate kinase